MRKGIGGPAYRIVIAQFGMTILASAGCMVFGWVAAYSAFLGGMTCALPGAYMAWRFLREVADPGTAFSNLVRGEVGKLLMTTAMFVVIFATVKPLAIGFFLATLVLGLLCNLVVPLFDAVVRGEGHEKLKTP